MSVVPTGSRRILTMQRRLRELGRIRTGWSEEVPGKTTRSGQPVRRPVKSKTFILTSAQRNHLEIGADRWGGTIERWKPQGASPETWRLVTEADTIEALLPPGDPLTSYYEAWQGPTAVRRCDGVTELLKPQACVCVATLGEAWWEREDLTKEQARDTCKATTRLNVFLDLDDFGYWRLDMHSVNAAIEMAGYVDLIKGYIGPNPVVPIRLRIEQRAKPGKQFQVVVMELRGQVAKQILSGIAPRLEIEVGDSSNDNDEDGTPAIGAGPAQVEQLSTVAQARAENRNQAPVSAGQTRPAAPASRPTSPARPPATPPTQVGAAGSGANETGVSVGTTGSLEKMIAQATTDEQMRALWNQVADTKDTALKEAWRLRRTAIRNGDTAPAESAPVAEPELDEPLEGEAEPDKNAMWTQALGLAGKLGWDTATTSRRFREGMGADPGAADGFTHQQFVEAIQKGLIR